MLDINKIRFELNALQNDITKLEPRLTDLKQKRFDLMVKLSEENRPVWDDESIPEEKIFEMEKDKTTRFSLIESIKDKYIGELSEEEKDVCYGNTTLENYLMREELTAMIPKFTREEAALLYETMIRLEREESKETLSLV